MKKISIILIVFLLILSTAIIKNSAKKNEDEIFTVKENLPSRSAKLRYVKKKADFYDFETDILDQFKNLIEIENFGDKLWKRLA